MATALIAEDETIIRVDIRGALEEAGYEVCAEARHGVEAVELARSAEPDIAVLDVKMPKLDGIEAARQILEHRSLPILLLSAADITDVQHSLRLRDGMIVLWGRPASVPEPALVTT